MSPKRKQAEAQIPPESSLTDSPRTKVARRLLKLELERDGRRELSPSRDERQRGYSPSREAQTRRLIRQDVSQGRFANVREIAETPQKVIPDHGRTGVMGHGVCDPLSQSTSIDMVTSLSDHTRLHDNTMTDLVMVGDGPQTLHKPTVGAYTDALEQSVSQTAILGTIDTSEDEHDYDPSRLTWQEHEITGHEIDTIDLDDDGQGINGIGFRPTPAIAEQRALARKRQVAEYDALLAREERQRRVERRKLAGRVDCATIRAESVHEVQSKREVRFSGD